MDERMHKTLGAFLMREQRCNGLCHCIAKFELAAIATYPKYGVEAYHVKIT